MRPPPRYRLPLVLAALGVGAAALMLRSPRQAEPPSASAPRHVEPAPAASVAPSHRGAPRSASTPASRENRWQRIIEQPPSFERDAALAATLEELAASDPEAAAKLLLTLPESDRRQAVAAVLLDASRKPHLAVDLAHVFCRVDAQTARNHGYALISALSRSDEFEAALRFVDAQSASAGEAEEPQKWLKAVYAAWAERQPAAAVTHAATISDPTAREEALATAAKKWAQRDPATAVAFVEQQPENSALRTALPTIVLAWAEAQPSSAAEWLGRHAPAENLDRANAMVASHPETFREGPELALKWAQRITHANLQTRTIAGIVTAWAATNPAAARAYLETATTLPPEERARLLSVLNSPPD